MTIRVAIVDDQALVRRGFAMVLGQQDDIEVVAEAANGREALEVVADHRPDVVLMDIRMPELDGLAATRQLLEGAQWPLKVIILTTFDPDEYVFEALQSGASGFILKDIPPEELAPAVRAVAADGALLDPGVTKRLIERFARSLTPSDAADDRISTLTDREREILAQVARGGSNAEIAEALVIAPATVKTHVSAILAKLGLRDRVQAVVLAYETGLVAPGDGSAGG